eukprot:gb/GEZN01013669.1/.p1 GENE.gb/GEZN01013669.1/~~gb/GEZN01013669.1/.p1  ORF type:complete len:319 (-),score=43.47 gb/GEZN01013669.1/:2-958(-)
MAQLAAPAPSTLRIRWWKLFDAFRLPLPPDCPSSSGPHATPEEHEVVSNFLGMSPHLFTLKKEVAEAGGQPAGTTTYTPNFFEFLCGHPATEEGIAALHGPEKIWVDNTTNPVSLITYDTGRVRVAALTDMTINGRPVSSKERSCILMRSSELHSKKTAKDDYVKHLSTKVCPVYVCAIFKTTNIERNPYYTFFCQYVKWNADYKSFIVKPIKVSMEQLLHVPTNLPGATPPNDWIGEWPFNAPSAKADMKAMQKKFLDHCQAEMAEPTKTDESAPLLALRGQLAIAKSKFDLESAQMKQKCDNLQVIGGLLVFVCFS